MQMRRLLYLTLRHKTLFTFLGFCFLFITTTASAQYSLDTHNKALADPAKNKQKFDQQTFAGFINSANTALIGCQEASCPKDLKIGAIDITSTMVAGLYANPPASGVAYVQDVIHRINPVQPAYAQTGTGFNRLAPLLPIWRAFRNFAYVLFAIIFIFIGLAVMFRMKLDPRTTLTIQSAIPRIIIALLLVTFSYAIAGLLIDFLYLLIALLALALGGIAGLNPATDIQNQLIQGGFGQVISYTFGTTLSNLGRAIVPVGIAGLITTTLSFIAAPLGWITLVGAGFPLLVILVIILWMLFRLFLELLRAYIMIIILVVLAPLQIALGAIPGMPGFGDWFKNIMANILVFPAVAFVLLIGQAIARVAGGGVWVAPLLAGGWLLGQSLPLLVGLGFLIILPQIPQVIRNMFGIRGIGFALGEALGPGPGLARAGGLYTAARYADRVEAAAIAAGATGAPAYIQMLRRMLGIRPR